MSSLTFAEWLEASLAANQGENPDPEVACDCDVCTNAENYTCDDPECDECYPQPQPPTQDEFLRAGGEVDTDGEWQYTEEDPITDPLDLAQIAVEAVEDASALAESLEDALAAYDKVVSVVNLLLDGLAYIEDHPDGGSHIARFLLEQLDAAGVLEDKP